MKFEKKKNSNRQKNTFLFQITQYSLQTRIGAEEEFINFNLFYRCLIYMVFSFQQIGIIIIHSQENIFKSNEGTIKTAYLISQIVLPNQFIQNSYFMKQAYLFPLLIIIIMYISLITQYWIHVKRSKNHQLNHKENSNEISVITILRTYFQLFYLPLVFIPFLQLSLQSIKLNLEDNLIEATLGILAIILQIITLIASVLFRESIKIKLKNLALIYQSSLDYTIIFLIITLVVIEYLNIENYAKFYLMVVIIVMINSTQLFNCMKNFPKLYCDLKYELGFIILIFIISLVLFIGVAANILVKNLAILVLILYPLAYNYFSIEQNQIHFEVMFSGQMNLSCQIIQYRVVNILDQFHEIKKSFINKPIQIYTMYIYLMQHKSNCEDTRCLCENENIQFEQIIKLYLLDQVKQLGQSISQIKDQSNQFTYFIHYLSLINYLGMNTNAFQLSNIAIFEESVQTSKIQNINIDKQLSDRKHSSHSNEHASSSNNQKSKYSKESIPNIKMGDTSFFQKQKLLIMQNQIKTSMSSEFLKDNAQSLSDNLQHAVKLFLDSEQNNDRLKRKVMKILVKKRDYFSQLLSQNSNFSLFRESKKLMIQIDNLDSSLQKMYQQFPSQKMQALNAFYQAEIRNNYYTAFKIANITSVSDEKLLKMQSQTTFDLFSSKVVYLLVGFDEKSHKPIIQGHSNLVHEFFGMKTDQFKMIKSIDALLPNGFGNIHQKLISQFLQTGKSKYFRQIEQSFCTVDLKELKTINFFFDIDSKNLENMTFACFFQDYLNPNSFIFVSLGLRILSFTKNIGQKLGYPSKVQQCLFENLYSANITNLIPNFQELVSQQVSLLELTRKQRVINLNQITMYLPDVRSLEKKQRVSPESHQKLLKVDGTIFLQNVNNQILYYIIEIIEAKQGDSLTGDKTVGVNNESINVTQEFIDPDELQSLDILNEEMVNQPNAIESMNIEDQGISQFGIHLEIKQQQNNNNINQSQNQSYFQQQNISIISPKNIGIRLLQNGTPQIKSQRQQFFSAEQNEDEQNASESVVATQKQQHQREINNKIDLLQMDDIDQELQDNIKMQMQVEQYDQRIVHIDDIGSQVSSIAGMRKSKYFKKYELLEKMLVSVKFSINFKIMVGIVFIYLLFASSIQVVQIVKSKEDLNRFLQELDMVQIRSNIMGPVDKYIVCLNAATNYVIIAYYFNFISIQQAIVQMKYSSDDINYTYSDLKQNFANQLSNPYLDPFFKDQYIEVYQSTYMGLQQYNLTIRQALNIYLKSSFLFQNIDFVNIITLDVTQSYIVYLLKNYENFTELFKSLNVQILEYSINRSKQVSIQWWSVFIPVVIISGLLCIAQFIFYRLYLQQYQKILRMFLMIESVWVQRDIDRYKGILSLLAKDSDVIFKYTFDIDLKEKFLQAEDYRKDKLAANQKNKKLKTAQGSYNLKKITLSKIPSIIGFCCLFLFSLTFFVLSNQLGQTYFTKYQATTNFFNRLSDLSVATSGVFAMRQISYQIQLDTQEIYYFFGHNATYFIKEFFENIETINNFLSMLTTFDQSNYLTSVQFYNQLQLLLNSDVCQFLPEQKRKAAQSHCDAAYNGVLRRGFQETLIKIRDSLLNEYIDSGNFSLQAYTAQEELEVGLISYDIVNQLRLQFQIELINYTNNLIKQLLTINLVFIFLVLLLITLLFTVLLEYFKREFKQVKQFIQLLPQTSLLLDVQLDREIRQMILKDNLI